MIPALCESHLHSYSSVGKALNYSSSCAGETGRSHISYLLDKALLLYFPEHPGQDQRQPGGIHDLITEAPWHASPFPVERTEV